MSLSQSSGNLECPVCLEEIGENNRVTTECGHTFHLSCILTNLQTSTKCPMCRSQVHDQPILNEQLESLEYEDVEDLEYSISERTGRNEEVAREIVNLISGEVSSVHPSGSNTWLTPHLQNRVRGMVTRHVSEIVHDFVFMLRDWASNPVVPDYPLNNLEPTLTDANELDANEPDANEPNATEPNANEPNANELDANSEPIDTIQFIDTIISINDYNFENLINRENIQNYNGPGLSLREVENILNLD